MAGHNSAAPMWVNTATQKSATTTDARRHEGVPFSWRMNAHAKPNVSAWSKPYIRT